ncbi:MAG: threonine/serine exporter family protein [Clostridiales bacterium]|nr:threonine/serine exporter family protein [Clostridiales bacterium]
MINSHAVIHWLIQIAAPFCGTVSFALIFGVPRKYYILCGITGTVGWLIYALTSQGGVPATEATFLASATVVFLSRIFAVNVKCPVTVFLISGIIPLVPGSSVYWAAYYLVTNETGKAMESGFAAIRLAVAIVLGIVIILELPNRWFHLRRRSKSS